MANSTSTRTSIIATDYNGAVFAAGGPIYTAPSAFGKNDSTVLVLPGQVVFYNPETGLSTGEAATAATVPNLKIGVGIDLNNDGISEDIRWFNDGFSGCSMHNQVGRSAVCGLPSITDAHFGCIECNQTYTIEVQVYSPITETFGEKGLGYIYHFSYHYPCGNCASGDCVEETPNADEVMCGLYNKIKGINNDPNWDITLNSIPVGGDHEYLFDVSKLYDGAAPAYADDTTFEYCLTAADATCENCTDYTPVGGYSLDGDPDVVFSPATFTGTISKRAQIDSAISQLNAGLAGNGSAVFLPAVGNCCATNKIEVNTCLTAFELHDHEGTVIVPCATSNPFSDITVYSECQDCDSTNSTTSFTAGLRFYSKPVEGKCDCIPGNHALVEYFSEVEVYFKRGWNVSASGSRTVKRQYATLPKGQGFQWQARELAALEDGFTEPFVIDNWGGKYGFPEPNDRLNQVTVNCKDRYCIIGGNYYGKSMQENTGEAKWAGQDVYLLVPDDHTTAKTSILAAWNAYFTGAACGAPATVTCGAY